MGITICAAYSVLFQLTSMGLIPEKQLGENQLWRTFLLGKDHMRTPLPAMGNILSSAQHPYSKAVSLWLHEDCSVAVLVLPSSKTPCVIALDEGMVEHSGELISHTKALPAGSCSLAVLVAALGKGNKFGTRTVNPLGLVCTQWCSSGSLPLTATEAGWGSPSFLPSDMRPWSVVFPPNFYLPVNTPV